MNRISGISPILNVSDMQRSLDFYVGVLGFENADWGDDDFTGVTRDDCSILLCRDGQGQPGTWIYLGIEDARRMHEQLVASGAKILMPPTNRQWALELNVEDPDGHVLRFGSEPEG